MKSLAPELNVMDALETAKVGGALRRSLSNLGTECGVIIGILPNGPLSVRLDSGVTLRCARAASCLLQPAMGDVVLVAGPNPTRLYVIAVVEQADQSCAEISVASGLRITSKEGRVDIEAHDSVSLIAKRAVDLGGETIGVRAKSADCDIGEMRYIGTKAIAAVVNINVIGRVLDVVMSRITQISRTAFRVSEEMDQTRAKVIHYQASEMLRLHGKHSAITADKVVKADGKQIHIG